MTWTRFDPKARTHPKAIKAGNDASSFWQWAILWANENETGGFLDDAILHTVPPTPIAPRRAKELAEKCVSAAIKPGGAGLFERVENGYQIHDFHDYQPPVDQDEKKTWLSEVRSSAGKKGASKRWQNANGKPPLGSVLPLAKPLAKQDGKDGNCYPSRAGARRNPDPGSEIGSGSGSDARATLREIAPDSPAESGYDLAWRVWSELWAGRYGEAYQRTTDTGAKGDDRTMQRIGALALELGERAEAILRQKLGLYLASQSPWLICHRHPPRTFETDWNSFGNAPPSKLARVCVESDEREPTDEERAARRKEMDDRAEWAAKERERRAAHEQTLGAK